jgi:PKD repeat protein
VPLPPDRRLDLPLIGRLLVATLAAGCGGGTGLFLPGDGELTITVEHGDGLSGRVGEPLSDSLVFAVTNRSRPVEGARVVFELTSAGPGADVTPDTADTDANGKVHTRMVLGTRVGPQGGEARVLVAEGASEPTASFTVIALPENANGIAAVSGDNQTGPAGSVLTHPLVVEVTDAFGNPIPGVPISWIPEGGGSVSETSNVTGANGRASVLRTLGSAAGEQTTLAISEGLAGSPVTFVHTATSGSAAGLTIVAGNNQTAEVGTVLPIDPTVRLADENGNPVEGAAVTWVVSIGGGTVTPQNTRTDAAGQASVDWRIGPATGENRLDAVVSGVGVASFTATGTSRAPDATTTTITSDAPDPSIVGSTITVAFRVTSNGPTPTGTVTVTDGSASCSGTLRDGAGSCQLTLNTPGDRTLRATYSGGPGLSGSSDTEPHRVNPATPENRPPHSDYNWHCEGLTCDFTDRSTDPDGQVTAWSWNFGDGSAAVTQRNPTHRYAGPGTYTVTLTVTDNRGATHAASATVEVEAPPPPPPGGTTTTITGDDPDPSTPGQTITVSFSVTSSSGTPTGTVRVTDERGGGCTGSAPSGGCSYVPQGVGIRTITATYEGNSSFSSSSAAAQHTVTEPPPPPNQAPQAQDDGPYTTEEDSRLTVDEPGILANDSDPDGDELAAVLVSNASNGQVNLDGDGSFEYEPNPNFSGDDSFTYQANDGRGGTSNIATVRITVAPVNEPPRAEDDEYQMGANQTLSIPAPGVLVNDSDPDGDGLSVRLLEGPENGTLTLNADGSFTYTPNPDFNDRDEFTYAATDGIAESEARVRIEVGEGDGD